MKSNFLRRKIAWLILLAGSFPVTGAVALTPAECSDLMGGRLHSNASGAPSAVKTFSAAEVNALEAVAAERGFSGKFILRLANDRPDVLKMIADHPGAKPLRFYRGVRVKDIAEFKPDFMRIRKHDEDWMLMMGGFYQDGKNFDEDVWVTPHADYALIYARSGDESGGVVIEYEVPDFMAYQFNPVNDLEYRLKRSVMQKNELMFITRIATLKTKAMELNSAPNEESMTLYHLKDFVDQWIEHDQIKTGD